MLDFDANITPSAETFSLIRYGETQPDLYTGAFSYQVPVFTYKDLDFNIPVSLNYRFDGYKPAMARGSLGLGWSLSTGGVITREVRGVPDEQYLYGDNGYGVGGWYYTVQKMNTLDTLHYYRHGPWPYIDGGVVNSGIDLFGAVPCFKTPAAIQSLIRRDQIASFEACPDLFHFNIDGVSGSFILGPDGVWHVFGDNVPFDLFTIELIPVQSYPGSHGIHPAPAIRLIRKDGYQFCFGGDFAHTEFGRGNSQTLSADEADILFTAFHLNEIIAPNGRTVHYIYREEVQHEQCSTLIPNRTLSGIEEVDVHNMQLDEHPYSKFSFLLSGIDVDDIPVYRFSYENKLHDEYESGNYENPVNSGVWDVSSVGLALDPFQKRLSSIVVLNAEGDTVRNVVLSHSYSSSSAAAPKMFLRTVSDSYSGITEFHYNNDSQTDKYPYSDTKGIDHWGYWNGKQNAHTAAGFIPVATTSQQDTTLYLLSSTSRNPSFSYAKYGALNRIIYPTGGESQIDYEAHGVPKMVIDENESGPQLKSNYFNIIPGGVRVKRIIAVDGSRRDTTSFCYDEGELLFMPRYCALERFNVATSSIPGVHIGIVPWGFAIGLSPQSGLNLFNGTHIGYRNVNILHPGGARTENRFAGYADNPDVRSMQQSGKLYTMGSDYISCGPDEYDHLQRYLLPCHDGSLMRGKLLNAKEYTADSVLIEETSYSYLSLFAFECTIGENVISTMVKNFILYYSAMPGSQERTIYFDNGSTTIKTLIEYDSIGREISNKTVHENSQSAQSSYTSYNDIGWISRRILSTTRDGDEFITGYKSYLYESDNPEAPFRNPQPSIVNELIVNKPVLIPSDSEPWGANMLTADGTNRVRASTITYYDNYFPRRITSPGGRYTEYTWDVYGRNITGKTTNSDSNTWSYTWKDLIGLASETDPAGFRTDYVYDCKGRLHRIIDNDGNLVSEHGYHLINDVTTDTVTVSGLQIGGTNYVLNKTFLNTSGSEYRSDIEYYDGLGFPCANITAHSSGENRHLVTIIETDSLRRANSRVYLPFVQTGTDLLWHGADSLKSMQNSYWLSQCGDAAIRPYTENRYQNSPAGKLIWTMQPGNDYAIAGKKKNIVRRLNSESDHILKLDYLPSTQTYSSELPFNLSGEYSPGILIIEAVTDEDGKLSETITDSWGNIVCTRAFPALSDTLETYYVRDLHHNITCIVQPEGSHILHLASTDPSGAEPFCFQYRHDGAGNMLRRKVPGGCWEDFYYNSRDLLIANTDERLLESGLYHWIQYDNLDRVTGETYVRLPQKTVTAMREDLYWGAMVFIYAPESDKIPIVQKAYYKSGYNLPIGLRVGGLHPEGYLAYEKIYELPNLDGSLRVAARSFIERSYEYGSLGRLSSTEERDDNTLDNIHIRTTFEYDHIGNIVHSMERHAPEAEAPIATLINWMDYDGNGRLIRQTRKIDSAHLSSVAYDYDDLGRLSRRTVTGSTGLSAGVQSYSYDIRGREISSSASLGNDAVFTENVRYQNPQSNQNCAQWAGNISEYVFKQGTGSDNVNSYYYDGASRLTGRDSGILSESFSYNKCGSIISYSAGEGNRTFTYLGNRLSGISANGSNTAAYSYDGRGNRISDSRNGVSISYNTLNLPSLVMKTDLSDSARLVYLADGTQMKTIEGDGHTIRYRGSLIYKQNTEASGDTVVGALWDEGFTELSGSWWKGWTTKDIWYVKDYLGNVREKYDITSSFTPNNALSRELSRSDYYPYGQRVDASTNPQSTTYGTAWNDLHRKHFGGKEETGDAGLNLLDFGARYYDPYSFSWTSADPLAENSSNLTPYSFCGDNPVNYIDPEGKDWTRKFRRNTVIVSMKLYSDRTSYPSAKQAADFWNKRKGDTYTRNGKEYQVRYEILVQEVDAPKRFEQSNFYTVTTDELVNPQGQPLAGKTEIDHDNVFVRESYSISNPNSDKSEQSTTGAHELGHLMGIEGHKDGTIMSESQNEKRSANLIQRQIIQLIESPKGHTDLLSYFYLLYNRLAK